MCVIGESGVRCKKLVEICRIVYEVQCRRFAKEGRVMSKGFIQCQEYLKYNAALQYLQVNGKWVRGDIVHGFFCFASVDGFRPALR